MLYDDNPIVPRRGSCQGKREPLPPGFHIGASPDSPRALCGFTFGPGDYEVPWHEGPLDCAECWRLQHDLEAKA